jgi:mono/diheme cytochrome c family protein
MLRVVLGVFGLGVLAVALLGVRGVTSERRPLMLFPDMDFQPRYDAQEPGPFFADGRAMRTPPSGTVPFGGADYASDAGSPKAGRDFLQDDPRYYRGKEGDGWVARVPVKVDMALLDRGRERFNINCAVCHGETGSGDGITTKYGLVGVPSYHDDRLRKMADGEIFHAITNGKGIMMPYGHQVKVRDRWAIVAYVRALQRSQNATLDDVPAEHRAELNP